MAMGLAGSLDDAMKTATANLSEWLEQDYGLTPSEIAQVLGTSVEYVISEVADRNAGMVAKLNKQLLAGLAKSPPKPPTQ
jgi:acetamidase/formamidase